LTKVVERVKFDIVDDSRNLPSLTTRPQDVFMSTSATRHQNFRCEFETVKNARADPRARTDSSPARVGFSKSRTADTITAAATRLASPAAFLRDFARLPRALHVASSQCQEVTASTIAR